MICLIIFGECRSTLVHIELHCKFWFIYLKNELWINKNNSTNQKERLVKTDPITSLPLWPKSHRGFKLGLKFLWNFCRQIFQQIWWKWNRFILFKACFQRATTLYRFCITRKKAATSHFSKEMLFWKFHAW